MFSKGIIVSCQPRMNGYFYDDAWKFAGEAQDGGAVAVRIEGFENISKVSQLLDIPIIGLRKLRDYGIIKITPRFTDAESCIKAGAEYVATDATGKNGYDELKAMVKAGFQVIGDIATFEQARTAQEMGCIAITTALSGYTEIYKAKEFDGPHLALVEECCMKLNIPVIAEGRYYESDDVFHAFYHGAYAVCIGAAITLPDKITKRYTLFKGNL